MLYHFGTGTRSSKAWRLKRFYPQACVEIGKPDAIRQNINNDDKIKVISPTGEVTALVKVTDTLPEGTLFMPISFPEVPVNKLFDIVLDPQSKTPAIKSCSVRIERIDPHGSNE
jgi:anaerobic selenocysteine-containing dehydrogenase